MGALEHSSNVIWHAASVQSLEAKILCTLINVHKLVSLLRITPTGKSCWWGSTYCHQTALNSKSKWKSSAHTLTCLCTRSPVHWHTPFSVWQLLVHMYVFLCVWCRVIMALWVSCHWQTSCISWILNKVVSWKEVFLQKRFKDKYSKTMHGRWKQLPFLPWYSIASYIWLDARGGPVASDLTGSSSWSICRRSCCSGSFIVFKYQ